MSTSKAFSIIELLVVMVIIAILTGLAVFGIGELNKNSRDAQRVITLSQMVEKLNDYKKDHLNYPETNEVAFSTTFNIDSQQLLTLTSSNIYGNTTTSTQTRYEYENISGKYGLCAVLESGKVENVGEVIIDCL